MQKLILNLQYCYGIKKLETELDFSRKKTFAIYAPNGVMKTSFAKTFKDRSQDKDSQDLVFPERKTVNEIQDESKQELKPEEVFVIEPYNEQFDSDKAISTLLVKKGLKERYDEIYRDLDKSKVDFIKKLKDISKSTDCESEFMQTFKEDERDTFFGLLLKINSQLELKDEVKIKFDFKYNDVFDRKGKVENFLDAHKQGLDEYISNYESLISDSTFFKKTDRGSFGTYQAGEILKSIKDDSYFEAGHLLKLKTNEEITSSENYERFIQDEIQKILSDEKLKKSFGKIDKAIGANTELRSFKSVLERNNLLLIELKNYEDFKKRVWLFYFYKLKTDVKTLIDSYNLKKDELEKIIKEANDTKTDWKKAVEIFNERFKGLPFELKIENQDDVILKTTTPSIKFIFHDSGEEKNLERKDLLEVLSQGERRALYILNIIFEVEARKKSGEKTLFIIDDIADSFDYKNKYAIIEYLKDISERDNFYQIILTHNFDFYRSASGRLCLLRKNKLNVVKSTDKVIFIEERYQKNPFNHWKDNLNNSAMLIASIPFVRNLAEYCGFKKQNENEPDQEYEKLTSLLHIKSDTNDFTVQDLQEIFKKILKDKSSLQLNNANKKIIDLIFELADEISQNTDEVIALENKIVLSIAIRLKTESFMIQKINDSNFLNQITKNQTIELIKKYRELFPNEAESIELLEQVNLMTPENIHLNSFMYEPILDMSDDHLKSLYKRVKNKQMKLLDFDLLFNRQKSK